MKSNESRFNISSLIARLVVLVSVIAVVLGPVRSAAVVINEINYQPLSPGNPAEFIELHNPGTNAVDLSGWQFDAGVMFTFPPGTTLAAHGYLVVAEDPSQFATRWGFTPLGPWIGKLDNEGEEVRLRDAASNLVDSVTYEAGFPWPTAARGAGSSMELIHPALDNDLGGSWRASGQPAGAFEPQVYLSPNDVAWRYRKGTNEASAPTSAWRQINFIEDATWTTAQTSIGYGDDDDRTQITDMQGKFTSLFLRRMFSIPPGAVPSALKVKARVDDGCIIWINGQEVARFYVSPSLVPAYYSLAQNHDADVVAFDSTNVFNAAGFLVEGDNVIAVQAFNSSTNSSDFTIDVSLEELSLSGITAPTPGAANSCAAANAPPAIRQVNHLPEQPVAGQPVIITAKITDTNGVAAAVLKYQPVQPGSYIRRTDAAYATNWITVPMVDDGTNGDTNAGDFIFTAVVPGSEQVHRRLVRYRIAATDTLGAAIEVPYADDAGLNFAYFVYTGFPVWTGAFNPGVTPAITYPTGLLATLPAYQLLAANTDVVNSQYNSAYNGQRFYGTLVYDGRVYDHIQFNNRGEASTYVSGKNKWRFHFNPTRELTARDNWGRKYDFAWNELNLNAAASPWCAVHRGMSGVEEAVSFRLYELIGMASPRTHFLHFRIIDDVAETGATQFQGGNPSGVNGGDLWGVYLAVEQPDGAFLDERGLPDGNVYKIESSNGDKKHQGDGQPTDTSDWVSFLAASKQPQAAAWWRTNMNLEAYYNFHAGNRIVGNVDVRPGFNHYFHHSPDGLWRVLPWDLDMMFIPKTHWSGTIDQSNCLNVATLKIEYQNRARELLDLMCSDTRTNGGQFGQLVDEYARMIAPPGTTTNWATLDAAMWNHNPRTQGDVNSHSGQTSHRGNFYWTPFTDSRLGGDWVRTLSPANFDGLMKYLADYATDTFPANLTWAVNNGDPRGYGVRYLAYEANDASAPQRPTAMFTGNAGHPIDDLRFSASAYAGANAFAAAQWRIGEISALGIPLFNPAKPRVYEVTDVWRSTELPANGSITIPTTAVKIGHTYRARVRHKDITGRWSRWSPAVQFVVTPAPSAITSNDLVVAELMYNPPALSAAETNAGYTDKQLFEYVELLNISTNPLDLGNLVFTNGINYTFTTGTLLVPGERIVVAKSTNAIALRYGDVGRIVGDYTGSLDNAGERVALQSIGLATQDFTYSDGSHPVGSDPWPIASDGNGPSLVLMNPDLAPDHNLAANWRASTSANGSPGRADLITYTEWAQRQPGLGGPQDDDDLDGWSNQAEYMFGTSPTNAAATPAPVTGGVEILSVDGESQSHFVFTFQRSATVGDVDYAMEISTDLTTWPWTGVRLEVIDHGNGLVTERWRCDEPISNNACLFARLRAQFRP